MLPPNCRMTLMTSVGSPYFRDLLPSSATLRVSLEKKLFVLVAGNVVRVSVQAEMVRVCVGTVDLHAVGHSGNGDKEAENASWILAWGVVKQGEICPMGHMSGLVAPRG